MGRRRFDPQDSFADGLKGLLRRLHEPETEVKLTRSIREEFEQNAGGKWKEQFDYVIDQEACGPPYNYPSMHVEIELVTSSRSLTSFCGLPISKLIVMRFV